ncbi:hypothetical protein ACFVWX_01640 [Streptomyces sp. NPDC058220]|uniref:hypothetical protein n=1 Tax=unclassified Streptomyces TaxID=2593676 RepID=UPI0036637571
MTRGTRALALVVVSLICAASVTGCAGSDKTAGTTEPPAATPPAATAPASSSAEINRLTGLADAAESAANAADSDAAADD